MGTRIAASATARPRMFARGALEMSDLAARSCLARGHHRATDLDLLVNVGIYKDRELAEPALASIIQDDLGANRGHPPLREQHGTFSFDICEGGNGVLAAAHVADGFVAGGTAKLAMIVAADSPPSRATRSFPFAAAAGALLLEHDDGDGGFVRFAFRTFPEHISLFEAATRWRDRSNGFLHRGHHVLDVYEAPAFSGWCASHGRTVAAGLLADLGVAPREVDLVIASQYPRTFALDVARGIGVPEDRVPRVGPELARAHTAGPIAALEAAFAAGTLGVAHSILFVTVGAGITVAAALYRNVTP